MFNKMDRELANNNNNLKEENNMNDLVIINEDNELITTSRKVAEVFEKRHNAVIRSIRNLECSNKFYALNFQERYYADKSGKKNKMYNITRDGFTFLTMGYTGKKAAKKKIEILEMFNKMDKN